MPTEKQLDINMESDLEFKPDHIPNSLPPMSNTDNKIPEDLKKEIENGATKYVDTKEQHVCAYRHGLKEGFIAGATEYAQYKVKYEQAERLLDKFMARHEAGLLPDIFIYNEIKSFLDGSK